ncbi:MAG: hypothetical protein R3Y04_06830 [Rikenellaceae bacterium]
MKKTFIVVLFTLLAAVILFVSTNNKEVENVRNNEKLYFYDGELSNTFYVNKSLLSSFDGYKDYFNQDTDPKTPIVEVNYMCDRLATDKLYNVTWLIKDDVLYMSYIGNLTEIFGEVDEDFQAKAYDKMEEYTNRKFDTPFDGTTEKSNIGSKLMKADWVDGEFYISESTQSYESRPWKKVKIKSGEVVSCRSNWLF